MTEPNPNADKPQTPQEARASYGLELARYSFNELADARDIINRLALAAAYAWVKDFLSGLVDEASTNIEDGLQFYLDGPPRDLEGGDEQRRQCHDFIKGWVDYLNSGAVEFLREFRDWLAKRETPGETGDGEAA